MKVQLAAFHAILVVIVCGTTALAQQDVSEKVEFRKWDIGTTVGILAAGKGDFGRSGSYDNEPSLNVNLDAGRYLTTHLKADAGLMWTNSRSYYESATDQAGYTFRTVRPTTLSGAITYQFFENVFAHPYLTTGLRVTFLPEHRETYLFENNYGSRRLDTRVDQTSLEVRPFAGFGFKSYFNERWFMRSELLFAFGSHGISHGTVRIGFGVDF